MPPTPYRALTSSPFAPFTHDRWRSSPTPEPIPLPKVGAYDGHISWACSSTIPPLTFLPHRPGCQKRRPSVSSDASESDDDESLGPVTPRATAQAELKWSWEDSPFKDDRWFEEPLTEEDEEDAFCGPSKPDPAALPKADCGWRQIPFRDERWRSEPVRQDEEEVGDCGIGKNRGDSHWNEGAESEEEDLWEHPSDDERSDTSLRRVLWPAIHPRQGKRRARPSTPELEEEDEQDRFWLGHRAPLSPSPSSRPRALPRLPSHGSTPIASTRPSPTGNIRRSPSPDPVPRVHIATHLSSRLGHLCMLDAASRLITEEDMSGLSMYLYCPKKHVREVWGEAKVRAVKAKLDGLELECPGFNERVFVHAHETINLACPPVPLNRSGRTPLRRAAAADVEVYESTIEGLSSEMTTLEQLGLRYLVVHPGSSIRCGGTGDDEATLKIIAGNIDTLLGRHSSITIVLESMTCTNHRLAGTSLRSLSRIRALSSHPGRIKFCLDLSHVHSMSHDLSTASGRAIFFEDVETWLGGENVICGHVSECGVEHGTGRDVHADFGSGYIGDSAFRAILTHPLFAGTIWIIETPRHLPHHLSSHKIEDLEVDRQALDIAHLRALVGLTPAEWSDTSARGRRLQVRERALKELRRKMWAEVKGGKTEKRGVGEERRAREERKKRGKLGRVRARARIRAERDGDEEERGEWRSPKRVREALAAKERRAKKRKNGR